MPGSNTQNSPRGKARPGPMSFAHFPEQALGPVEKGSLASGSGLCPVAARAAACSRQNPAQLALPSRERKGDSGARGWAPSGLRLPSCETDRMLPIDATLGGTWNQVESSRSGRG